MACESLQQRVADAGAAWASARSRCAGLEFGSQERDQCEQQASQAMDEYLEAQRALRDCLGGPPPSNPNATRQLQTEGFVTFLLVQEEGSGFGGGSSNQFDADVVFELDTSPGRAFGFYLHGDSGPIHEGMLALLRDAMATNWPVVTNFLELVTPPNQNSFVLRVAVMPPPKPPTASDLRRRPSTHP